MCLAGGVGQGKEGKHDVWAGMPYERLATIRISDVTAKAGRVRVVADAGGAYPPESKLRRFTRAFAFDAPDALVVHDEIDVEAPQLIESFIHADAPIRLARRIVLALTARLRQGYGGPP